MPDLSSFAPSAASVSPGGLEIPPAATLEIDHSRIDAPEDTRALGIRNLAEAGDIVRVAPGADA